MNSLKLTSVSGNQLLVQQIVRILLSAVVFAALYFLQSAVSEGQEVRKTIRDYFSGPIVYSPSDPWFRGKVFNAQTGHSGRFYNCDDEECKRNSPYICWKTHYENDIPQPRGLWRGMKMDLAEVRQRICDGAGPCCDQGCQCAQCVATNRTQPRYANQEPDFIETPRLVEAQRLISTDKQPATVADRKFGLLSAPLNR